MGLQAVFMRVRTMYVSGRSLYEYNEDGNLCGEEFLKLGRSPVYDMCGYWFYREAYGDLSWSKLAEMTAVTVIASKFKVHYSAGRDEHWRQAIQWGARLDSLFTFQPNYNNCIAICISILCQRAIIHMVYLLTT